MQTPKKFLWLSALPLTICLLGMYLFLADKPHTVVAEQKPPHLVKEAREITAKFQKILKSELQTAMKSGGLIKAVTVCHKRAPEIAKTLGEKTGWQIARTALKTRNDANAADKAATEILNQFETRKTAGEPLEKLEWWEKKGNGFTYMKAIPTGGVCTKCHGTNISETLKTHIQKFYPNDQATGFKPGDIRGAFRLKKGE